MEGGRVMAAREFLLIYDPNATFAFGSLYIPMMIYESIKPLN